MPEKFKELLSRKLAAKSKMYSVELGVFSLTLHYYSPRGYNYVRKVWGNLLPHPSTLRRWYTVVDGTPEFTYEAFHAMSSLPEKIHFVNLVLIKCPSDSKSCTTIINFMEGWIWAQDSIRRQTAYIMPKMH